MDILDHLNRLTFYLEFGLRSLLLLGLLMTKMEKGPNWHLCDANVGKIEKETTTSECEQFGTETVWSKICSRSNHSVFTNNTLFLFYYTFKLHATDWMSTQLLGCI